MSVGIVIPVWNLWEKMTLPCLMSLVKYTNIQDIHVYLVDNASTDETCTHAEKMGQSLFGKEHFTYIKNSENMGFAIACNQGAKEAQKDGHEFILFLNNDTIVTENWLPPLVNALDNSRVGMAGPLLLYPDNTVQHCGVVISPFLKMNHIYGTFPKEHYIISKNRKFRAITGAVLLCRIQEFFDYGMFYEEYKNGMEDIDLCYSYVEHGQLQQVISKSIVYHYTSQTPGRLDTQIGQKNGELLFQRKKNINTDAHLYYAQDGYLPALTKDFSFYARLKEEKRKALNKEIQLNYSDSKCLALLKTEPFWHDGYWFLMQSYEKQGHYMEALAFCQKAFSFCITREILYRFIELAQKTNDEQIINNVNQVSLDYIKKLESDHAKKLSQLRNSLLGTEWYDRLLETQKFDTGEFGDY